MALFIARYDLRAPVWGPASRGELYEAALDQVRYCDERGFDMVVLSEHHGVADGYLSSPITVAAAMAAATERIPIMISALLVPLHDPLRLAEQMAVADNLSGGRIQYTSGLGYRRAEYEAAGLDWADRGNRVEHCLETLARAWTGEPFEFEGRTVRITPAPLTEGGPMLFYGGGSKPAARRAARLDMPMFAQHGDPTIAETYQAEREELGLEPGLMLQPSQEGPGTVFVAEDPDAAWDRIGEHLLYEATEYAAWQDGVTSAVHDTSTTVTEMRDTGVYAIMTPDECVEHARAIGAMDAITLHPLCGGIPPAIAWEHLRLVGEQVIPAVRGTDSDR